MIRTLACFLIVTILTACTQRPPDSIPPLPLPPLDASTPESALKSWWAMRDWEAEQTRRIRMEVFNKVPQASDAWSRVTIGDVGRMMASEVQWPPLSWDRRILDVKFPSERRAEVTAIIANTTSVGHDGMLSTAAQMKRKNGAKFMYVLLQGDGWKVSEVWEFTDDSPAPIQLYGREEKPWASWIVH